MMPVLRFGGLALPMGPFLILLAFIVGSELGSRALGRIAPNQQQAVWRGWFSNAAFWAAGAGLVVARLAYAVDNLSIYLQSPYLLFSIRPGAFALWPGLIVMTVVLVAYLLWRGVSLPQICDAVAIGLVGTLLILSLRDFLLGEAYGLPTTLPWGIELWKSIRHPVQLYEMALEIVVLALLWAYQLKVMPGITFWRFVALIGFSKLLVEAFRADVSTFGPGLRTAQVISFGIMVVGLYVLSLSTRSASGLFAKNDVSEAVAPS